MQAKGFKLIINLIIMVLLQALFFNHIRLLTYALPIVYFYPLIKATIKFPRWFIILAGAMAGFLLDVFMNTMGVNMFAATLIAFIRRPIIVQLMDPDEVSEGDGVPSTESMSTPGFLLYLLLMVAILVGVTLLTEAFSVYMFKNLLPYLLGTIVLSYLTVLIIDYFNRYTKKKE